MPAVKVLHEIKISPSLPSQPPQRLSFLDIIWLQNSQLVERLFFYDFPHPISHFINHTLPIFTKSLSLTLHHYYLLAGSIRPCSDSDGQFEIAYAEGDSVPFTVAEFTGDDFRSVSGHHPRSFETLHLLVKKPEKSSSTGQFPPISIQVTLFPSQGVCIGFTVNHAACDGSGSLQFIRSWAAACRLDEPTLDEIPPPFLDRSIIIDTCRIQQKIFDVKRQFKEKYMESLKKQGSLQNSDPEFVSATFTLCKDHILRLKKRVQEKGSEEEMKASFHVSAFVVTCAYIWRCLVKARGYDGDSNVCFGTVVDWRSRMRPPIPSNYFGNCLGTFLMELKAGELVGKNGFEVAAMEIGKSIYGLQGRDVGEVIDESIGKYIEWAISRPFSVAGSPKLRVYEIDFGWGKPVKVEITSIIEGGAISLAESRDEDGGLEIGLVLSKEEMEKFMTNFSTDLLEILG